MSDMAKSIAAAAATQPDGMVVSLPDPDALGQAIKDAVAAGIPVITMNSGLRSSKCRCPDACGSARIPGWPGCWCPRQGRGRTKGVCFIQEAYNTALNDRCNGYGESVPTSW